MDKITVTKLGPDHAPDFEIGDRDGEHVATLSLGEAVELRTALNEALRLVGIAGEL